MICLGFWSCTLEISHTIFKAAAIFQRKCHHTIDIGCAIFMAAELFHGYCNYTFDTEYVIFKAAIGFSRQVKFFKDLFAIL